MLPSRGSASSGVRAPPCAPPGAPLSGRLELFPEGPLATVLRGPFPRFIRFPTLHFISECGAAARGEEAAGPRGQRVAPGGDGTHLLTAPWQSPGHAGFRGPPPGEASSLQKPEPRLRLRWPLCPGLLWGSGDLVRDPAASQLRFRLDFTAHATRRLSHFRGPQWCVCCVCEDEESRGLRIFFSKLFNLLLLCISNSTLWYPPPRDSSQEYPSHANPCNLECTMNFGPARSVCVFGTPWLTP